MHTTFDEMPRFDPTNQIDAVMSRRSFLKSATAAMSMNETASSALASCWRVSVGYTRIVPEYLGH